jgi:hypothetical protein
MALLLVRKRKARAQPGVLITDRSHGLGGDTKRLTQGDDRRLFTSGHRISAQATQQGPAATEEEAALYALFVPAVRYRHFQGESIVANAPSRDPAGGAPQTPMYSSQMKTWGPGDRLFVLTAERAVRFFAYRCFGHAQVLG